MRQALITELTLLLPGLHDLDLRDLAGHVVQGGVVVEQVSHERQVQLLNAVNHVGRGHEFPEKGGIARGKVNYLTINSFPEKKDGTGHIKLFTIK